MLDKRGRIVYNCGRRLTQVTMKQIKVSDKVAEILDRKRGKKQKTYSQAIEDYIVGNSWLQFFKWLFRRRDDA